MATRHLTVKLTVDTTECQRAMARAAAKIGAIVRRMQTPAMRRQVARWQRSHPAPLCIDGAAYARKRKARRRRR